MADEEKDKQTQGGGGPEEEDYVKMIMERHKPVTQRGAGAIAQAILIPIVIILVIGALVWIALAHVGDSYSSATFVQIMRQSQRPLAQQNVVQKLFTPNFDHLKVLAVPQVLYSGQDHMVLPGGYLVQIEGMSDLRGTLRAALQMGSAPMFKVTAHDKRVHVDAVTVAGDAVAEDLEFKFIRKLELLDRMPSRSAKGEPGMIARVPDFKYDDETTFKKFLNRTIAVAGKPVMEEDRWILNAGEWKLALLFPPEAVAIRTALELAEKNDEQMMVDVFFETAYPWKNRRHPEKSRSDTKIVGEGQVVSLSIQGLHVGRPEPEETAEEG